MKYKILKLLEEAKVRKKSHNEESEKRIGNRMREHYVGRECECDFFILKLESLLNEQPEAITEDSHLRKHDVGRSAVSEEITTLKNDASESSSETQAVGQNEQTRKVCQHDFRLGFNPFVEVCVKCGKQKFY